MYKNFNDKGQFDFLVVTTKPYVHYTTANFNYFKNYFSTLKNEEMF